MRSFLPASDRKLFLLSVAGVFVVAAMDYFTGAELSFSLFYLIPISLSAWFLGRRQGILLSLLSAALWLEADFFAGSIYTHPSIPFWNAAIRLGFFLVVTFILSSLRFSKRRQEELLRFVIHDLRAPLSNIMAGLNLIRNSDENDKISNSEILEICEISSERLMTLINSILDLSKLESGKMPLQIVEAGAAELLEQAASQVKVLASNSEVDLKIECKGDIKILIDRELTLRVIVNLLSNAIRFTHSGKSVTLRCENESSSKVRFEVCDQGRGIPADLLSKVFDPYFQVESHKIWGTVGTGLGLTFVKLAVEAQNGQVWLNSKQGEGTSVFFSLPAAA